MADTDTGRSIRLFLVNGTPISSCARSNPARPLLGLLLRSLSIRRSAAATRSRARSRSATVYCRGSGRVRFLRGPFAALLARMVAFNCFPVAIVPLRLAGAKGLACEGIFSQSTRPVESINLSAS